jgi:sugar/nucleoside kinase (ribokinase family)
MNQWDILGLGAVAVDDLLTLDHFPAPDSKMAIRSEQRQGGGLTATALVAAARLGARPAFMAVLGDDSLSQYTLDELAREGVDCTPVIRQPNARPVHSTILVDTSNGQRTILYSHAGLMYPTPAQITDDLLRRCRVLFVDQTAGTAAVYAAQQAQALGIPVVADVENVATPEARALIRIVDHLIMGIETGRQATGLFAPADVTAALGNARRACSCITAGAQGCWYTAYDAPVTHVPSLPARVVDTTGCGDVFHGAYAAGIACGEPVAQAIQVATIAAGLKATQIGGRAGIPDRATVDRVLASPVA